MWDCCFVARQDWDLWLTLVSTVIEMWFNKMWIIAYIDEDRLATQEGLTFMKLIVT